MSDENHIAVVAQMAAILVGRGGGQGAKARRKAARRAWALYAEVRAMESDGMERLNGVREEELETADA
jgi:hypothetical protein